MDVKRSWIALISLVCSFALVVAACGTDAGTSLDDEGETGQSAGNEEKTIAVIVKSTEHEFWQTVKKGAEEAGEQFGYNVTFQGASAETAIGEQVSIVEDAINQQVAAIVLAPSDPEALAPPLQNAEEAGIPVVTIDSSVDSDIPESHVSTDNRAAAGIAAEEMAGLIGEEGKVAIVSHVAGASTAIDREEGFKEMISKFPNIEIVNTFYSDGDREKALQITQDILTATPDIKGIFGANEGAAVGVANAIEQAEKADDVVVIGFDSSEDEISFIEKDVMKGIVVQNPFNIGYMGVEQAAAVLDGQNVEQQIDTGATFVNQENLQDEDIQKLLYPLDN